MKSQKLMTIFELFNKSPNLEEVNIIENSRLRCDEIISLGELAISLNKRRQKVERSQSLNYTKGPNTL